MHFPDVVLRAVAGQLLAGEDQRTALLSLVAACGVNRHWREVRSLCCWVALFEFGRVP